MGNTRLERILNRFHAVSLHQVSQVDGTPQRCSIHPQPVSAFFLTIFAGTPLFLDLAWILKIAHQDPNQVTPPPA